VVTRCFPCKFYLAAILAFVITATVLPACADTPHYYNEFNSGLNPWQASEEKNFEEVFKNY
jgi:hypothetical protein